ncbi:serine hydrolase domain-containing protein, partial [Paraburkholderia sp. SIMBA_050]
ERQATVRELLEARSGVYHATTYETPWMQRIKPPRGSHAPGAFWCYNNWDFNALGGIYRQQSGHDIFTAFADEIASPIGMQDYAPSDGRYASGEPDTRYPAYPIDMSTRDLARFVQ